MSLKLGENLSLSYSVTLTHIELGDLAGDRRCDHGFHFHRLEYEQDVIDLDGLPSLDRDPGNGACKGAPTDLALVCYRGGLGRGGNKRSSDGHSSWHASMSWWGVETGRC